MSKKTTTLLLLLLLFSLSLLPFLYHALFHTRVYIHPFIRLSVCTETSLSLSLLSSLNHHFIYCPYLPVRCTTFTSTSAFDGKMQLWTITSLSPPRSKSSPPSPRKRGFRKAKRPKSKCSQVPDECMSMPFLSALFLMHIFICWLILSIKTTIPLPPYFILQDFPWGPSLLSSVWSRDPRHPRLKAAKKRNQVSCLFLSCL